MEKGGCGCVKEEQDEDVMEFGAAIGTLQGQQGPWINGPWIMGQHNGGHGSQGQEAGGVHLLNSIGRLGLNGGMYQLLSSGWRGARLFIVLPGYIRYFTGRRSSEHGTQHYSVRRIDSFLLLAAGFPVLADQITFV